MKRILATSAASLLLITACIEVKEASLFDAPPKTEVPESVQGFYGVNIFDEELTADFWGEENKTCFQAERTKEGNPYGEYAMKVKWDKDIGACDWIGMGFGWNGWMAKDLEAVFDTAALSMRVKPVKGSFGNLPVAISFEDYAGKGAWLGFSPKAVVAEKFENGWTYLEFPLSEFNWAEQGTNPANIKQLIIQLEATGEFYFDEIKIVKRIGGFDKRYTAIYQPDLKVEIDGKFDDAVWTQSESAQMGENQIMISASDEFIYFAGKIEDETPRSNTKSGADVWNGDAFEFCIRNDPYSSVARKFWSTLDQHIALGFGSEESGWSYSGKKSKSNSNMEELVVTGIKGAAWDFSAKKELNDYEAKLVTRKGGMDFEFKVPISELGMKKINTRKIHPFEMALDFGDAESRKEQLVWNSPEGVPFHESSSSWGEIVFQETKTIAAK